MLVVVLTTTICSVSYCLESSQNKIERNNIKQTEEVVQLRAYVGISNSAGPLVLLAETIQKDKTSNRFRINWNFTVTGGGGLSTALYDRQKSTLKLFATLENSFGKSYTNYLYSDVNDEIIKQLAEKYGSNDDVTTNLSFIDRLQNGKDLGGTYVSYPQPEQQIEKKSVKPTKTHGKQNKTSK